MTASALLAVLALLLAVVHAFTNRAPLWIAVALLAVAVVFG